MKKRLLSLFLAFVTLLGILPTAALAANTEEEALGEVDIYNGGYELSYLTINGRIRTQDYTYFNYVDAKGQKKEVPAYCVNPNIKGVPQTVGVGESIKYLANERSSDPKVVGIISNGYPHRSLGELKLDNKYQAYYATKMALWCYLLPNWNIANLKVAPGLTGSELDIGNRILAAAKDIYKRGTTYNYMLEPRMTATPDKSAAYSVTVDGKQYKQQVFTIWSETWVYDYDIAVSFADPGSVPQGTRIVDENDQDITAVTTKWTGDGYGGKFKVLYPADSIEGESGSVQLSLTADVAQYAAMYAVCQEKDKYGNLQNYICDLDNSRHMELAAVSSYTGGGEPDPKETALKIVKLEEGTKIPLEGAVFSVYDPEGRKVGSFSTSPDGTVIIPLTLEGHYTVTEEIPPQYHLLSEERTQHADVEYNKVATLTFWNAPYAWFEDLTVSGRYYLRELENEGYIPDTQERTVYVKAGETTKVTWKNTPITGQIQIVKKSADYNPTTGLPAGTLLEGAVFEITDKAGNVVDTIRSDSRGLAVSKPLPLSRYTIREVKAPSNYGVNEQELTAYLEHEGQIVRFEVTNKSLTTGVSIAKTGPKEAMSGQPVRYTFSGISNTSNVRLDSFYFRDSLPAQVRLSTVVTGTWNFPGTYKITYRVNGGEHRTLADNLSTSKSYTLDASAAALGLAGNERVTEIMFVFGQAPAGFAQVEKPYLNCTAVSNLNAGSSFVNIADVGGVYNGTWVQAISRWVTKVYGKPIPLPRTGY